jgi:hypothetical protein
VCQHWCIKFKYSSILVIIAHYDRCICKLVIALAEEGLSARIAGELYSVLKSTA